MYLKWPWPNGYEPTRVKGSRPKYECEIASGETGCQIWGITFASILQKNTFWVIAFELMHIG